MEYTDFEERAAIMEYDGNLTKNEAEKLAKIDTEKLNKEE